MKRPTVREMIDTYKGDQKEFYEYALGCLKKGEFPYPRTRMDQVTFNAMTKDQKDTFNYIVGSYLCST